jgi:hypothetical protein
LIAGFPFGPGLNEPALLHSRRRRCGAGDETEQYGNAKK